MTSEQGAPPPRAAHSPRQDRSRGTLERILAAAEELLETREFDELTMADLAEHASCAVGTVYGRIPNKESLLVCLHERHLERGAARAARVFSRGRDSDLPERVRRLCGLLVDFLEDGRGVTRAVTNYLFTRPSQEISGDVAEFKRGATDEFRRAAAFLAEKVDPRIHSRPQAAAEFGLLAAHDVAQSRVVFGDRSGIRIQFSSRVLKERISDLLLSYLTTGRGP